MRFICYILTLRFVFAFLLFFRFCRFCRCGVLKVQAVAYSIRMLDFLPTALKETIVKIGIDAVYEIRLRADSPVTVNLRGRYVFVGKNGVCSRKEDAFVFSADEIADTLYAAGDFSVYSVEEQLRRGFVTARGGVRIGIGGEYVFENGKVIALKRANALCVRIPHRIRGCADEVMKKTLQSGLRNVLIISAPGKGKTTLLREIAEKLAENSAQNVTVCDERGEIAVCGALKNADVISYVDKAQAFSMAIRALKPDVIVTDELSENDTDCIRKAIKSGVFVVATAHFDSIESLPVALKGVFDSYVLLSNDGVGKVKGVFDGNLKRL